MLNNLYLYEIYYRFRYICFYIIYIYIYIITYSDEITQFVNSFIFIEDSFFFVEYYNIILPLYTKRNVEFSSELFIDYHILNSTNNIEPLRNLYLIFTLVIYLLFIMTYEIHLFIKPILYAHELLHIYMILFMLITIIVLDIYILQVINNIFYVYETTDLYNNIEWTNINMQHHQFINVLLWLCSTNIISLILLFNKNILVFNIYIYILFIYLLQVYITIDVLDLLLIICLKSMMHIEYNIIIYIYNNYIFLLLQKKSIGICTGMYKIK